LKAEHAFRGGYTVVKDYVRQARLKHKEVFVPLGPLTFGSRGAVLIHRRQLI
jgi:hypothetical protein